VNTKKKFISINELKEEYSYYKIQKLVTENKIDKINKRYYENLNFFGEEDEYYYVDVYISGGVICQLSAAVYYELTTYRPNAIDVAVKRKRNISTLPDYPVMNPIYYSDDRYETGISIIINKEGFYKIYDIEKTICDILFYRNKIGIDIMKEIITNYIKRKDKDFNKLVMYAKKLNVYNTLKTYFEVLL